MKFTSSLMLAAAAVANAGVIERRQLIVPQSFGLKVVSSDPMLNGKFLHPSTGSSTLATLATTSFMDLTFMLIGSSLIHGSDDSNALMAGAANAPITAAALPTYFRMVPSANTPLYLAPIDLGRAARNGGDDIPTTIEGVEVSDGLALTKDGHLTLDGAENWLVCDDGLHAAKGAAPKTKGCTSVKVVKA